MLNMAWYINFIVWGPQSKCDDDALICLTVWS